MDEVARVALQAAELIAQVNGGILAVCDGGTLRPVLTRGYLQEVADHVAVMDLAADLLICHVARSGLPSWLPVQEAVQVVEQAVPTALPELVALPLVSDGVVRGVVAVSWSTAVDLDDVVRARLLELAGHVGRRLAELA